MVVSLFTGDLSCESSVLEHSMAAGTGVVTAANLTGRVFQILLYLYCLLSLVLPGTRIEMKTKTLLKGTHLPIPRDQMQVRICVLNEFV